MSDDESTAGKWADILKPFAPYIAAVLIGGGAMAKDHADAHKDAKDVTWTQVGDHLQDLVKTNELWKVELEDLRARITQLENKK